MKSAKRHPGSVGMLYHGRPEAAGSGTVYGAAVASRDLMRALARHSRRWSIDVFSHRDQRPGAAAELEEGLRALPRRRESLRLHSFDDLCEGRVPGGVGAWHEVTGLADRVFQLRRALPWRPTPFR
jgi:hypothetical protein